jgi:hypothetical protein
MYVVRLEIRGGGGGGKISKHPPAVDPEIKNNTSISVHKFHPPYQVNVKHMVQSSKFDWYLENSGSGALGSSQCQEGGGGDGPGCQLFVCPMHVVYVCTLHNSKIYFLLPILPPLCLPTGCAPENCSGRVHVVFTLSSLYQSIIACICTYIYIYIYYVYS